MPRHFILLLLITPLCGQVGRNRNPGDDTPVFRSTTQLVIETVTVKDKDGRPLPDLTAKDFSITEDGAAQEIRFFEYQQLDDTPKPVVVAASLRPAPLPRLTRTQIAPEPRGDLRYRNHRLLALYFDMTAMPPPDQYRALAAAKQFIRTGMSANDLMAVMAFRSGAVEVFQDFTGNRERLLETIETLIVGEDESAPASDTSAAFGQNDSEFNIFFTDRQLAALQTAASMLGRLSEKKSLIYFTSGLRLNGANNQAQLYATLNAAVRAGVSLFPVDARGLVAQAPLGDATSGSPGGTATYTGVTANAVSSSFQRSQDTLWTLAADTGGKALLDNNDLTQGIVQAQRAVSSYYILGYYTTNTNTDGKFRKVKIALNGARSASLDYRQGYYAQKVFSRFTSADKERQLEEALMLQDPITELTIAMEIGYFQLNRAEYFVPVMLKIPGSELALARKGGAERTTIDFIGEVKDEFGTTVSNVRDKVEIRMSGATAAELARRPIEYDTGFTLLPGRYRLKLLARDAETGRMGTYDMRFAVPNLNREQARIPISSVILGSQRVALRDALFSADKERGRRAQTVNPLVSDGQKLIPSVTRVFRKAKEMYVYFQTYQQGEQPVHPLVAYVTFFRDGYKAFETSPLEGANAEPNRLRTIPFRFSLPLEQLDAGEYLCQVTVLDSTGKRAAFWQSAIMLVP